MVPLLRPLDLSLRWQGTLRPHELRHILWFRAPLQIQQTGYPRAQRSVLTFIRKTAPHCFQRETASYFNWVFHLPTEP